MHTISRPGGRHHLLRLLVVTSLAVGSANNTYATSADAAKVAEIALAEAEIGLTQDQTWGTGGTLKLGAGNEGFAGSLETEFTADAQTSKISAAWQFQENQVLTGSAGYAKADASRAFQDDFADSDDLAASNVRIGLQTGDGAITYEKGKADDVPLSSSQRYAGKQWQEINAQQRLVLGAQAEVLISAGIRKEEQDDQKDMLATGALTGNYYLTDSRGKISASLHNWREGGHHEARVRYEHQLGGNNSAHWFSEARHSRGQENDVQWLAGVTLGEKQRYTRPAKGTVNAIIALDRQKNTLHHTQFNNALGNVENIPDTDPVTPLPIQDADSDGVADINDNCPADANSGQADTDADGVGDACDAQDNLDTDADGVQNSLDQCPATPAGAAVTVTGCQVLSLDTDRKPSLSKFSRRAIAVFYVIPDLTQIENARSRISVSSSHGTPSIVLNTNTVVVTVASSTISSNTPLRLHLFIDGVLAATAE